MTQSIFLRNFRLRLSGAVAVLIFSAPLLVAGCGDNSSQTPATTGGATAAGADNAPGRSKPGGNYGPRPGGLPDGRSSSSPGGR